MALSLDDSTMNIVICIIIVYCYYQYSIWLKRRFFHHGVLPGSAEAVVRWGWKVKQFLIACFPIKSNISAKIMKVSSKLQRAKYVNLFTINYWIFLNHKIHLVIFMDYCSCLCLRNYSCLHAAWSMHHALNLQGWKTLLVLFGPSALHDA